MLRRSNKRVQDAGLGAAMAQFSVCRQPWNEYIKLVSKEGTAPYHAEQGEKPMYRGRLRGREGWLFSQQVQQHYSKYPDEHIFTNLSRWRHGDTVGDIGLQQFRGAQPFDIGIEDEQGFAKPEPEVYMKLNYKNPATFSRFLTRTGHYYPQSILPMNPEAMKMVKNSVYRAKIIGIYPRFGNPFWHRVQQHRPKAHKDVYDPMDRDTKNVVEQFAANWLQNYRIQRYFRGLQKMQKEKQAGKAGLTTAASRMDSGYSSGVHGLPLDNIEADVEFSDKTATVPGLYSLQGIRPKFNLYSSDKKKRRFGYNPLDTKGI